MNNKSEKPEAELAYQEYKATIDVRNADESENSYLTTWRGDFINRIIDSLPVIVSTKSGESVTIKIGPNKP